MDPTGDFAPHIRHELLELRDDMDRKMISGVNWKDFVVAVMDKNIAKREENIKKLIQRLGKGGKTHLTLEDVTRICGGEEEAQEIFDFLDGNGDGKISLQNFQKAVEQSLDDEDDEEEEEDFDSDDEFA